MNTMVKKWANANLGVICLLLGICFGEQNVTESNINISKIFPVFPSSRLPNITGEILSSNGSIARAYSVTERIAEADVISSVLENASNAEVQLVKSLEIESSKKPQDVKDDTNSETKWAGNKYFTTPYPLRSNLSANHNYTNQHQKLEAANEQNQKLEGANDQNQKILSMQFIPSAIDPFQSNPFIFSDNLNIKDRQKSELYQKSIPVTYEKFYQPSYGNYPLFGEIQNFDRESQHSPSSHQYTAFALNNPKFNALKIKNPYINEIPTGKVIGYKYPEMPLIGESPNMNSPVGKYDPASKSPDNSMATDDWIEAESTRNKFFQLNTKLKQKKKTALIHALTTLIPLVLLLAAIPPNIVVLKPTDSHHKGVNSRNEDNNANSLCEPYHSAIYYLVENLGFKPSGDENCNKRFLCETGLKGSQPNATLPEYGISLLLNRGMEMVREKLHLNDIAEAILSKQCSTAFSCTEPVDKTKWDLTADSEEMATAASGSPVEYIDTTFNYYQ